MNVIATAKIIAVKTSPRDLVPPVMLSVTLIALSSRFPPHAAGQPHLQSADRRESRSSVK
jgi:hypothetical protein